MELRDLGYRHTNHARCVRQVMQDTALDISVGVDRPNGRRFALGFEAHVMHANGGAIQLTPLRNHYISMQLGPTVIASCRCEGRRERRIQTPGDIDISPIGYPILWEDAGPARVLSIALSPAFIKLAAQCLNLDYSQITLRPQLQVHDPRLEHICRAILASLDESGLECDVYSESLGLALAVHVIRNALPNQHERHQGRFGRCDLNHVLDYIGDNLERHLSLDTLASIAGLSTSHFKLIFRETVGTSVHRYVVQKRVEAAVHLLENGMPARDVAMQAGFANQSHMARLMKQTIGITPKDVR